MENSAIMAADLTRFVNREQLDRTLDISVGSFALTTVYTLSTFPVNIWKTYMAELYSWYVWHFVFDMLLFFCVWWTLGEVRLSLYNAFQQCFGVLKGQVHPFCKVSFRCLYPESCLIRSICIICMAWNLYYSVVYGIYCHPKILWFNGVPVTGSNPVDSYYLTWQKFWQTVGHVL